MLENDLLEIKQKRISLLLLVSGMLPKVLFSPSMNWDEIN